MTITDCQLDVQVRGSGPAVVMLHGWGLHSGVWDGLAGSLAQRYTLYLADLPGHGRNRESQLPLQPDAVVEDLHRIPAIRDGAGWLGWSLGGLIALQAAVAGAGPMRWLTLLAASPSFVERPHWPHGMDETVFRTFADDLAQNHEQTLARFMALEVHGARDAKALLRRLRAIAASRPAPGRAALDQGLEVLLTTDLTRALGNVDCPTAVIGGRRDRLVSPGAIEATAEAMDQAGAHLIPGAGHAPHLGHRAQILDIIESLERQAA